MTGGAAGEIRALHRGRDRQAPLAALSGRHRARARHDHGPRRNVAPVLNRLGSRHVDHRHRPGQRDVRCENRALAIVLLVDCQEGSRSAGYEMDADAQDRRTEQILAPDGVTGRPHGIEGLMSAAQPSSDTASAWAAPRASRTRL